MSAPARLRPASGGLTGSACSRSPGVRERCRSRSPSIGMQAIQNLAGHRRRPPDSIEVTGTAGLTGTPIQSQDWAALAQMVYEAGERS
jgi:hypothetical protein